MSKNKSVVAYSSISDKRSDELGDEISQFFLFHGVRAVLAALIVSTPVFLGAAALAPHGTNRLEYGAAKVGEQHSFLWHHGLNAVGAVVNTTGRVLGPIFDNGASE